MKFNVGNNGDGTPYITIMAETKAEKARLKKILKLLKGAQMIALRHRKAGRFNVCGSTSDTDGRVFSLTIPLALGGNVETRYVSDPADIGMDISEDEDRETH